MVAGFLLGLLPGWMKAYLNANEIVSTLMINAIVMRFYDFVLTNCADAGRAQAISSR